MSDRIEVIPEYIYVTIPAEYICVYHRILAMLADYGEEMLKDCKANCTEKNSGVIECFNMFNAAVAARKLGKDKLAETLIKYVKAKINQIYRGLDNSTSFIFPVDETGRLKAFVSCGERPRFEINAEDGELYEHKFNNGFDEHFKLGVEDESNDENITDNSGLTVTVFPRWEQIDDRYCACADIIVNFNGSPVNVNDCIYEYYFDDKPVIRYNDVTNIEVGIHNFTVLVRYNGHTAIDSKDLIYESES